jgi:hypothetical protein
MNLTARVLRLQKALSRLDEARSQQTEEHWHATLFERAVILRNAVRELFHTRLDASDDPFSMAVRTFEAAIGARPDSFFSIEASRYTDGKTDVNMEPACQRFLEQILPLQVKAASVGSFAPVNRKVTT